MYDVSKIDKIRSWLGSGSINIFGRPFAGKDAQGIRLADIFNGHLLGGGDILRSDDMPESIKQYMRTGQLIPTDEYIKIVLPYLNQENLKDNPLILSSVGRWHGEEKGVIESLEQSNHPLKAVVYLYLDNNESYNRWLARDINNDRSNRHDDTEEILNIRFNEFEEKTMPVIQFYEEMGILIRIDGKKTRDAVTADIIDTLFKLAV